jgi:maltooligosyltrehalose trehalohydrolase
MRVGARYLGDSRCEFRVWAPFRRTVGLRLEDPAACVLPMVPEQDGYWWVSVDDLAPGTRYRYDLGSGLCLADPASGHQPDGVHGPSAVVDHRAFEWNDAARAGVSLKDLIVYELHIGTFTQEGALCAIIPHLADLAGLGVTAIELMPLAQFPGRRNWGYDGVFPFAVQNSYGGPDGLKRLVDAAHRYGLAVILDAVYNHFGPEGNHFKDFGPYFTDKYRRTWGEPINFDGPYSDPVRDFFVENALMWQRDYHLDGLRLDAIDCIHDLSAWPFLAQLSKSTDDAARLTGRPFWLIAESDLNDPRVIRPRDQGGLGIHAQWCDDFHHALHALITGETRGYYRDFGRVEDFAEAMRHGFVYRGRYSDYRKRRFGASPDDRPAEQFLVFAQNHDQVGNRLRGDRLSTVKSLEAHKLAVGMVMLSPYVPLLFMGEEYAEDAPFLFFADHSDADLRDGVMRGRTRAMRDLGWQGAPADPFDPATFERSRIERAKAARAPYAGVLAFYRRLIGLRKSVCALAELSKETTDVSFDEVGRTFCMRRWHDDGAVWCGANFSDEDKEVTLGLPGSKWSLLLDSAAAEWSGPGGSAPAEIDGGGTIILKPWSLALYGLGGARGGDT